MSVAPPEQASRDGDLSVQGEVPATYVRLLYDYLRQRQLDPVAILGRDEPDPGRLERVTITAWRELLQGAQAFLGDPLLPLQLGRYVTPAHFGVVGYLLLACDNLGAALQRMEAYNRLLYDVNPLQAYADGDQLVLEWGTVRGRPGALVDETAIAVLLQLARDTTATDCRPLRVEFVNAAPADPGPYVDYFACPVRFACSRTRVAYPLADLQRPLRRADAALQALLEAQAERLLADLPARDELETALRLALARLAPSGECTLESAAAELKLSTRTLHRRLEARGLRFRSLRDDVLCRLALDHLANPHLQLPDIAQLLGYSEQSAFNRAFRRWTGKTPRQCRRAASAQ